MLGGGSISSVIDVFVECRNGACTIDVMGGGAVPIAPGGAFSAEFPDTIRCATGGRAAATLTGTATVTSLDWVYVEAAPRSHVPIAASRDNGPDSDVLGHSRRRSPQ